MIRVKMSYALELVGVLGCGMALARWSHGAVDPLDSSIQPDAPGWIALKLASSFLLGVTLAGAVGTWYEAARGGSPRPWGIGRHGWSHLALFFLTFVGGGVLTRLRWLWSSSHDQNLGANFLHVLLPLLTEYTAYAACLVLALEVTSRIAGTPRDPRPDAREWTGRALMTATLVHGIACRIYEAAWSL